MPKLQFLKKKRNKKILQVETPWGRGGGGSIVNIIFTVKNINTSCIPRSMYCGLKVYLDSLIETSCSHVLLMKPMNI
mgnify:CR=1 FL=1